MGLQLQYFAPKIDFMGSSIYLYNKDSGHREVRSIHANILDLYTNQSNNK